MLYGLDIDMPALLNPNPPFTADITLQRVISPTRVGLLAVTMDFAAFPVTMLVTMDFVTMLETMLETMDSETMDCYPRAHHALLSRLNTQFQRSQ
jgi:hypothetical protein